MPDVPEGHAVRVWVSDRERDFYTWRCTCGARGDRDILAYGYAVDDWRESHGLAPLITYPLI
jgi:hypothetical protein